VTQRALLLDRLSKLNPAEFKELVFLLEIPTNYISPGAPTAQAIEVIQYLERQSRLDELDRHLERLQRHGTNSDRMRPPEVARAETPSFPTLRNIPVQLIATDDPPPPEMAVPWQPAIAPRSRVVPIAAMVVTTAVALVTWLWSGESQVVDSPGELSAGIVDFVMGAGWHSTPEAAGRLVTDAVIASPDGHKPVLELTRVFDPRATKAGDMGLGWALFHAYSLESGDESEILPGAELTRRAKSGVRVRGSAPPELARADRLHR
jgi:hypothetical protein